MFETTNCARVVVVLHFIPEVRGEAGTDTDRQFIFHFSPYAPLLCCCIVGGVSGVQTILLAIQYSLFYLAEFKQAICFIWRKNNVMYTNTLI